MKTAKSLLEYHSNIDLDGLEKVDGRGFYGIPDLLHAYIGLALFLAPIAHYMVS